MKKSSPDPIYALKGSGSPLSCLKNQVVQDLCEVLGSRACFNPLVSNRFLAEDGLLVSFQGSDVLYSGNYDGLVETWSMDTRRVIDKIPAHPGSSVLWVDFDDNTHMFTHGRDGSVRCWVKTEAEWIQTSSVKSSETGFCGSCLLGSQVLAVPSDDQSHIVLHNGSTMEVIGCLKPDKSAGKLGMCMKIRSCDMKQGRQLLVGYEDGSVVLWDIRFSKMVDRLRVHSDAVMCMDFSGVLNKGFSGSVTEELCSWLLEDDKMKMDHTTQTLNPGFNDTLVRQDGKIVVYAGWDGNIRIFGAKKLKPLAVLSYHKESVHCLAFSDDNILACGSKDKQISLWDIYR